MKILTTAVFALTLLTAAAHTPPIDKQMVLEVDADTHMPLGPILKPAGVLLDPRDMPKAVIALFPELGQLEGLEQSLSAMLARHLAFARTTKKLRKAYRPHCKALLNNWNEQVGEAIAQLAPSQPDQWFHGALYQDTGRRPSKDFTQLRIVSAPEIQFAPMDGERFDELTVRASLLAKFGPKMEQADAKELYAILQPFMDDDRFDLLENPWCIHATSQVLFLKLGVFQTEQVEDNPFDISVEEFFKRCRNALKKELLAMPTLDEALVEGRVFFEEGFVVARIVADDSESAWEPPSKLTEFNEATHTPVLLLTVSEQKKYTAGSKLDRIRIAMVVGGGEVTLYDGRWPLR